MLQNIPSVEIVEEIYKSAALVGNRVKIRPDLERELSILKQCYSLIDWEDIDEVSSLRELLAELRALLAEPQTNRKLHG